MRTATAISADPSATRKKAVRRLAAHWSDTHPRRFPNRVASGDDLATIPFPNAGVLVPENVATRARLVSMSWSQSEREYRRRQALRKQEELLQLVAADELEDTLRLAVADGEQPVLLPECEL